MRRIAFRAMGCAMHAIVDTDDHTAERVLASVPHWFAGWEQHLSRFRPDSELSALNRQGSVAKASPVLWHVVQLALDYARATDGLVTPTLLDALEAAGYDRSFDAGADEAVAGAPVCATPPAPFRRASAATATAVPRRPGRSSRRALWQPTAWEAIRCDPATRSIRLRAGVRLDLGGIAKGWAADEAARRLAQYGPALVDAGGDIAVSGVRADGTAWPIAVADPRTPGAQLALILLRAGGIATSGRDYRRWQRGGVWYHHLIDPRTRQPAMTDVLSASVLGPSAVACDVAAKAWLLQGSHAGQRRLDAQPALAGIAICAEGSIVESRRFPAYRWQPSAPDGAAT